MIEKSKCFFDIFIKNYNFKKPGIYLLIFPKEKCSKLLVKKLSKGLSKYFNKRYKNGFSYKGFDIKNFLEFISGFISIRKFLKNFYVGIGQTANLKNRQGTHKSDLLNDTSGLPNLQDLVKEGKASSDPHFGFFMPLEIVNNKRFLRSREQEISEKFEHRGFSIFTCTNRRKIPSFSPLEKIPLRGAKFKGEKIKKRPYKSFSCLRDCRVHLKKLNLVQMNQEFKKGLILGLTMEKKGNKYIIYCWYTTQLSKKRSSAYTKRAFYEGCFHEGKLYHKFMGIVGTKKVLGVCRGAVSKVNRGVQNFSKGYTFKNLSKQI